MYTFAVSAVEKPTRIRATTTLPELFVELKETGVEASGANLPDLLATGVNPFATAVHLAFADHCPLHLAPDDVWIAITQAFAIHVNEHAEALRDRFVRHQGRAVIRIHRDHFVKGSPDNDWPGCFSEFSDRIAGFIGKQRDLVVASFSTTGAIEKAVSEVVLMGAMKEYFDYRARTRCGIPEITLLGTPDDWKALRQRAAVLAEYDPRTHCRQAAQGADRARRDHRRELAGVAGPRIRVARRRAALLGATGGAGEQGGAGGVVDRGAAGAEVNGKPNAPGPPRSGPRPPRVAPLPGRRRPPSRPA